MYELVVNADFSAAHKLRGYQGECERLHGHNWRVQVALEAERLDELGMVMDFREVKRLLQEVLRKFDHAYLNELPRFKEQNPTTENMARVLCEELAPRLPAHVRVGRVTAWESEGCGATYVPSCTQRAPQIGSSPPPEKVP